MLRYYAKEWPVKDIKTGKVKKEVCRETD